MQIESSQEMFCHVPDFFQRPLIKWVTLLLLFFSAFAIRLYHITSPPLDFAPIRQYQNAHNARAIYFNTLESVSIERKKIADTSAERMGFSLEPRVMEYFAVVGYRIAGDEKLWIPRILSSMFWVIGGIFLFLMALKIMSLSSAILSTVFYLFLPYGISASRSFQPDPLMLMLLIMSVYAILMYNEQPSKHRLLIAGIVSALAIFIKPYCVFLIFGAFLSLSINRLGRQAIWESVFNSNVILFSCISLMPGFLYYGYSSLSQGDAQAHIQGSFLPHLLLHTYFWKDWLVMIGQVTGYIAFAGALIGLFMSRGLLRAVLSGLWLGYFLFGLIFTYHIHTHSYYQLQLIPVVALSLIPVAVGIKNKFSILLSSKKHMFYIITLFVLATLCSVYIIRKVQIRDYKNYVKPLGAVIGVNSEFYNFIAFNYEKETKILREIGEIVNHSTNNVFLTSDFGRSLTYHGELAGLPWPTEFSMQSRKEMDVPIPDKKEIFNSRYLMVRTHKSNLFDTKKTHGDYIQYRPDYFIITSFEEFAVQPDLKEFLYENFPVLAQSEAYLIFDLRKMSE